MIHHPIILGSKLVLLLLLVITLAILHGFLPPDQFKIAVKIGIAVFILAIIAIWTGFFMLLSNPNSKLSKSMVLTAESKEDAGDKAKQTERLTALIGTEGIAESNLRPSGIGRFNEELIDVVSDRLFITKGEKIAVTGVDGKKLKVKKI